MDYGVMLKKTLPNPSRKSAHHQTQGSFAGSNRQLRGMIIKVLTNNPPITEPALARVLKMPDQKINSILKQLQKEGFIKINGKKISIV
jgi:A/G-specific adenine glycosylase